MSNDHAWFIALSYGITGVAVLGYNELIPSVEVESVALVMPPDALSQVAAAA